MTTLTIKTNNQYREILTGYDVPSKFHDDFDYMDDITEGTFFKYKGDYYDLGDFMTLQFAINDSQWQAAKSFTMFSGIVIQINDSNDAVKVGYYYS